MICTTVVPKNVQSAVVAMDLYMDAPMYAGSEATTAPNACCNLQLQQRRIVSSHMWYCACKDIHGSKCCKFFLCMTVFNDIGPFFGHWVCVRAMCLFVLLSLETQENKVTKGFHGPCIDGILTFLKPDCCASQFAQGFMKARWFQTNNAFAVLGTTSHALTVDELLDWNIHFHMHAINVTVYSCVSCN